MNLTEKKKILRAYILLKLEEGDYHAVSDAANDIRVLEAKAEIIASTPCPSTGINPSESEIAGPRQ